ncbi:MAG: hypothetical protein J07HX5_01674, partial [halophilic archaeon J07HX5]
WNQTGASGGAPVSVRSNSGMLSVNGKYPPAEESARTGVHAESPPLYRWVNLPALQSASDEQLLQMRRAVTDHPGDLCPRDTD